MQLQSISGRLRYGVMLQILKSWFGSAAARAVAVAAFSVATMQQSWAANIIGLADNPTSCGGATLCSTDGTLGYGGTKPFNLSTINNWFQIDPTIGSTSVFAPLPGQTTAQTMGAGNFLVVNDTGSVVTSFSLTLSDNFNAASPSVTACLGLLLGQECDVFQIHGGAANFFSSFNLTGTDCSFGCATSSASFAANVVTYNWNGGAGIPVGATFDLNFASWNNDVEAAPQLPEPGPLVLMATAVAALGVVRALQRRRCTAA